MGDDDALSAPSKTALAVLGNRVIHQLLDDNPKILDDTVSVQLMGPLKLKMTREIARMPAHKNLRTHVVLRSRFTEDRLAEAVRRGVDQYVILGAGYDSFAYRQPHWARSLRIFEVDQRPTQRDKQRRLSAAGVIIPDNLKFVEIDFEHLSLEDGLRTSGLDFSRPTFFSCLGVLVYLTQEANDAVFRLVASFPSGSEIAFTFSSSTTIRTQFSEWAASMGEPWLSRVDGAALRVSLPELGFSELFLLGPDEARGLYLDAPRDDGLEPPRNATIATAIVGKRKV